VGACIQGAQKGTWGNLKGVIADQQVGSVSMEWGTWL
jgi:hypothetical protein